MSVEMMENESLYSSLAGDPDLGEIVGMFVDEMPSRLANLSQCLAEGNWEQLGRYAHQMKGACGSYGFDQLTAPAARLEHACRDTQDELLIREAVAELTQLCQRVRTGTPTKAGT